MKLSCWSSVIPRCFWYWQVLAWVLLKFKGREWLLSDFWQKTLLLLVLFLWRWRSGFNCIFHWKVKSLTFCKWQFNSSGKVSLPWKWEKGVLSSAIIVQLDQMSSKSFMYIKNVSRPSTDPRGTRFYKFPSKSLAIKSYPLITCMKFLKKI